MSVHPRQSVFLKKPASSSMKTSKRKSDDGIGSCNPERERSDWNGFRKGFQDLHPKSITQKRSCGWNYTAKPFSGEDLYEDAGTPEVNGHSNGYIDAIAPGNIEVCQSAEAYGYAYCRTFGDAPNTPALPPTVLKPSAHCQFESTGSEMSFDKPAGHSQDSYPSTLSEDRHIRPKGTPSIPVIIELLDDAIRPWDLDLNATEEVIRATGGDGVLTVKTTCTGSFVVHVCNSEAAIRLQLMTTLLGVEISVTISSWYHENMARMRNVPLRMTNRQVLEALAPYGVIGARRGTSYTRLDNGLCIETPKSTIILNFAPHVTELPASLPIEGEWFEIDRCVRSPVQCMNCYGYQHHARQCTAPLRCKLCAGYHFHKECNSFTTYRCVNCNGAHAATYSLCPVRSMYMEAMKGNKNTSGLSRGPPLTSAIP